MQTLIGKYILLYIRLVMNPCSKSKNVEPDPADVKPQFSAGTMAL